MKIFSWMQNKLNGSQEVKKQSSASQYHNKTFCDQPKEEFSDWPHALLAIGTFGNNDIQEKTQKCDTKNNPSSSDENQIDFTPEEVGKLQKELTKLLSSKPKESEFELNEDEFGLPLDKFLNCPSSLEVERKYCNPCCEDSDSKDVDDSASSVVLSGGKDVCMNKNNSIRKKSVSFLLKKMFMCGSGFAPARSLADPIPESRMEKLLRTLLHKNIYPQSSTTTASGRKYLSDRHGSKSNKEDEMEEKRENGAKWVKTDSEYIVLEI